MSRDLTRLEREVYELIKRSGEIITADVPDRLGGAIPNLVNKGMVEVYKRRTSRWGQKKRKFLRVIEPAEDTQQGSPRRTVTPSRFRHA